MAANRRRFYSYELRLLAVLRLGLATLQTMSIALPGNQPQRRRHLTPTMRIDDRERMYQLCAQIEQEKDHHRFLQLIEQLNELLERQEQRLESTPKGECT